MMVGIKRHVRASSQACVERLLPQEPAAVDGRSLLPRFAQTSSIEGLCVDKEGARGGQRKKAKMCRRAWTNTRVPSTPGNDRRERKDAAEPG
ncbi:hypothetical protein MRX96_009696 [Rhipicephalus microplus]